MLLAFGNRDTSHWVHPFIDAHALCKGEHRRQSNLDVPVRSVRQIVIFLLVRSLDLRHQFLPIHSPEVPYPAADPVLDVAPPRVFVTLDRRGGQLNQ